MWVRRISFLFVTALAFAGGCVKSMVPGELDRVQPVSDEPRAGNVYLLRGFIGIFSYGIDGLGHEIEESGVRSTVFQDGQWRELADKLVAEYRGVARREPLVLIGHSYGADDVLRIAGALGEAGIAVDLVVTLDPVTPPDVPKNIVRCYNIYQSNGVMDNFPWLRGIALHQEEEGHGELVNVNIRKDRTDLLEPGTDHFNIEKKAKIHAEVVGQVLATCPPREAWGAAHPEPGAVSGAGGGGPSVDPNPSILRLSAPQQAGMGGNVPAHP